MLEKSLIYFDNAATTFKPNQVINSVIDYYSNYTANAHRGDYDISYEVDTKYEGVRKKVKEFINAKKDEEIVFTSGTTQSLNMIVNGFFKDYLNDGDEVLLTKAEHASNILPWFNIEKDIKIKYIELDNELVTLDNVIKSITPNTKVISLAHITNVIGDERPIKEITDYAHKHNILVVLDAAQSAPHVKIDVENLGVDFMGFSGHKMCGPTGIGVLYGKETLLNQMNPIEFGGEMIDFVYESHSTWTELPWKFEAGTPNIAGAIALGAAIDYLEAIGMDNIHRYEQELVAYVMPKLKAIEGLEVYGPEAVEERSGVIAFNIRGLHPHDLATALDMEGVAVRAGHHCAQPLLNYLGQASTARASFYIYNTKADCDKLVDALLKTKEFFGL